MLRYLASYKKIFGILGLLIFVTLFTAAMAPESFLKAANIENTVRWTALFGIISVGVSFVIMTGGIDLSIGSVVGLIGCLLGMALFTTYTPEDLVVVQEVKPDSRQFRVADGNVPIPYQVGDRFGFLENIYTITQIDGATLTVAEPVATGGSTGGLFRLHPTVSLGAEGTDAVRRGTTSLRTRTLTVGHILSGLKKNDRIELWQEVGLPQQFSISRVNVGTTSTEVEFLIRPGQNVRMSSDVYFSRRTQRMSTSGGIAAVLGLSVLIGLVHGLLITKIRLQPFVVTLCGLLIYRGVARYITSDQEQGFGSEYPALKDLARGDFLQLVTGNEYVFDLPMPSIYLLVIAVIAAIFLNKTIFGRYILALGRNEAAARYSGIHTERMVILAYVICSFCAGIAGILFALDLNSVQPSGHGEFYELYAIAAAVLGGCSLRGGEGSILGVVIAAAVMRVLNNAINLIDGIDTSMEFAIIGMVILLGVVTDEVVRRMAASRRQAKAP